MGEPVSKERKSCLKVSCFTTFNCHFSGLFPSMYSLLLILSFLLYVHAFIFFFLNSVAINKVGLLLPHSWDWFWLSSGYVPEPDQDRRGTLQSVDPLGPQPKHAQELLGRNLGRRPPPAAPLHAPRRAARRRRPRYRVKLPQGGRPPAVRRGRQLGHTQPVELDSPGPERLVAAAADPGRPRDRPGRRARGCGREPRLPPSSAQRRVWGEGGEAEEQDFEEEGVARGRGGRVRQSQNRRRWSAVWRVENWRRAGATGGCPVGRSREEQRLFGSRLQPSFRFLSLIRESIWTPVDF